MGIKSFGTTILNQKTLTNNKLIINKQIQDI